MLHHRTSHIISSASLKVLLLVGHPSPIYECLCVSYWQWLLVGSLIRHFASSTEDHMESFAFVLSGQQMDGSFISTSSQKSCMPPLSHHHLLICPSHPHHKQRLYNNKQEAEALFEIHRRNQEASKHNMASLGIQATEKTQELLSSAKELALELGNTQVGRSGR